MSIVLNFAVWLQTPTNPDDKEELDFMFDEELEDAPLDVCGRKNTFTDWYVSDVAIAKLSLFMAFTKVLKIFLSTQQKNQCFKLDS